VSCRTERSRLVNGLCDVLCNAVPVEVRGTLLWRTSAVWADCWHEGVHLAVDGCGLPISMLLTPARQETTRSCCRCSRAAAAARLGPEWRLAGAGADLAEDLPAGPGP
jgi:hypothetical protein